MQRDQHLHYPNPHSEARSSRSSQYDPDFPEPDRGTLACSWIPTSFFSPLPLQVSDWDKLSMPLAYLAIAFESTDGKEHAVEIYSDLSAGMYLSLGCEFHW